MAPPAKTRRGVRWLPTPPPSPLRPLRSPPPFPAASAVAAAPAPSTAARRVSWSHRAQRHGRYDDYEGQRVYMSSGAFALRNRAAWLDHRNAAEDVSRWRTEGQPTAPAVLAYAAPYSFQSTTFESEEEEEEEEEEELSEGTVSETDSEQPIVVLDVRHYPMSSYVSRPSFQRVDATFSESEASETETEVDSDEEEEEDEEVEDEDSRSVSEVSEAVSASESEEEERRRPEGGGRWAPVHVSPGVIRLDLAQPGEESAISAIALTPERERRRMARVYVEDDEVMTLEVDGEAAK